MGRIFALLLIICSYSVMAKDVVTYPWFGSSNTKFEQYFVGLLELALEKSSNKAGGYELVRLNMRINQSRVVDLVKENKLLSVVWTMANTEREEMLRPIRIPLIKGLGGCRIGLIKSGQQRVFNNIANTKELKSLTIGQGQDWPDISILRSNGFEVVIGSEYDGLFEMLAHNRFDWFLRSIFEAFHEVELRKGIDVESRYLFYYDAPIYFFVSKENSELAQRIKDGLKIAKDDGSLARYFENSDFIKQAKLELGKNKRELIMLDNPNISQKTKEIMADEDYQLCKQFTKA